MENVTTCLEVVVPFIVVLRFMDSEITPTMSFIYMSIWIAQKRKLTATLIILRKGKSFKPFSFKFFLLICVIFFNL